MNCFFLAPHLLLHLFLACSFTLSLSLFIGLPVSLHPSVSHCSLPLFLSFFFSLALSHSPSLSQFSVLFIYVPPICLPSSLSYLFLSPTISPTASLNPK